MCAKRESKLYSELGASSSKEGVASLLGSKTHKHFVTLNPDVCGDPEYFSLIHADGAGTKSIIAYLAFRETGDTSYFRSLAQDSLVMNLDDVACVGAFESLTLSNTIGRNRRLVPDKAVAEIVKGYSELIGALSAAGIEIALGGGETADVGDLVRTVIVDSTLFGRIRRKDAISTDAISPGDLIIGISGVGQATYESKPNFGLGSNGFTLARHALIGKAYRRKYPEISDAELGDSAYSGFDDLFEKFSELGERPLIEALLSPTRTYAPFIKRLLSSVDRKNIHGMIHCTGGGQTKALNFGREVHYIKDNLFPVPPIFSLIQNSLNVPWEEMYSVFNMGHRLEIFAPRATVEEIIQIAAGFKLEAQVVGRVEKAAGVNKLTIKSGTGEFQYSA